MCALSLVNEKLVGKKTKIGPFWGFVFHGNTSSKSKCRSKSRIVLGPPPLLQHNCTYGLGFKTSSLFMFYCSKFSLLRIHFPSLRQTTNSPIIIDTITTTPKDVFLPITDSPIFYFSQKSNLDSNTATPNSRQQKNIKEIFIESQPLKIEDVTFNNSEIKSDKNVSNFLTRGSEGQGEEWRFL